MITAAALVAGVLLAGSAEANEPSFGDAPAETTTPTHGAAHAAAGSTAVPGTDAAADAPGSEPLPGHFYFFGGVDAHLTPELVAHGMGQFRWQLADVVGDGDLDLYIHTDTLHAELAGLSLWKERLDLDVYVRGEALYAGLLIDHWQVNRRKELGFFAHYALAGARLKLYALPYSTWMLELRGRQWFFGKNSATDAEFLLPPETFVGEAHLAYLLWLVSSPGDEWAPHRLFPRLRGLVLWLEGGLHVRANSRGWGTAAEQVGRNQPGAPIYLARQELRGGVQVASFLRLQLSETAGWGVGEDDLTRVRVGGANPYVARVVGLPWAWRLADRFVATEVSAHLRVFGDSELGVFWDGAVFNDPLRRGAARQGTFVHGAGLLADLRLGTWQLDLRGGWAPKAQGQRGRPLNLGLFASIGKMWW